MNDTKKQIKMLLKKVKIRPSADLYCSLGVLYKENNDSNNAFEYFKTALSLDPEHRTALLNTAMLLENYDKVVALQLYERLYFKYPTDTNILLKLYSLNKKLSNHVAAAEAAKELIKKEPDNYSFYLFAADSLYYCGKYEEAIEMNKIAKEKGAPENGCDFEMANLYSILNKQDKVNEILKDKIPENKEEISKYAFINFRAKNYAGGIDAMHKHLLSDITEDLIERKALEIFYKYEFDKKFGVNEAFFRNCKPDDLKKILDKKEIYKNKDLYSHDAKDKKIFVYNRDGAGDVLMFSRYLHVLGKYTKNITVCTPKSLYRLFKQSFPVFNIIPDNGDIYKEDDYDYTTSFFSLLINLKENSLNEIPYSGGYLTIDAKLTEEKKNLQILNTQKKKIGIYWQGNPGIMQQRSMKLENLKPLFELPDVQIYSFQISDVDNESEKMKSELPLIDLAPYIKDYADTAAFLANMDVLVSIDTSIANLAGATGIKTYLCLPFESEWRWFYDTEKTPWYDSVRIFKQSVPYQWSDVVLRIKNELTGNY